MKLPRRYTVHTHWTVTFKSSLGRLLTTFISSLYDCLISVLYYCRLAKDLVTGKPSRTGAPPADLSEQLIELMPASRFDRVPMGTLFGDVTNDVLPSYVVGDTVNVTFRGSNPRNNVRAGGTYLKVQQEVTSSSSSSSWADIAFDGDWDTKFHWKNEIDDPLAFGKHNMYICTILYRLKY